MAPLGHVCANSTALARDKRPPRGGCTSCVANTNACVNYCPQPGTDPICWCTHRYISHKPLQAITTDQRWAKGPCPTNPLCAGFYTSDPDVSADSVCECGRGWLNHSAPQDPPSTPQSDFIGNYVSGLMTAGQRSSANRDSPISTLPRLDPNPFAPSASYLGAGLPVSTSQTNMRRTTRTNTASTQHISAHTGGRGGRRPSGRRGRTETDTEVLLACLPFGISNLVPEANVVVKEYVFYEFKALPALERLERAGLVVVVTVPANLSEPLWMLFQSRINQHFSAAGIVVPQFKVSSGSSLSYGGFASFPWDVLLQKARNGRALERPRGRDMLNESTFTLDHFTTRRFFHSALPRDVLFLSPKNDNLSGPIARYFQHPEPRHYSAHRCFGYFVLDLIWTDDPQEASRSPTCACPAQEAQTPPENVFVPVPASPQSALVCTPGPISLPDQRSAPSTVSYASLDRRSALETPSQSASSGMRSTPQSSVALPLFLPDEDQASRHPSRSPEPANTTRNLPRSEAPPTPTVAPSIPVDEMDDDERVEPFGHPSRLPDVIDMDSDAEGRAAVKSWMRKLSNCFPPIIEDTKALKGHATAKESTPGENTLALASNVIAQLRMIYKGDASFETSEGFIRFDPRVELWNQGCTIRGMMCSAMTFDAFRSGAAVGKGVFRAVLTAAVEKMLRDTTYFKPTSDWFVTLSVRSGADPERLTAFKAYGALTAIFMYHTRLPPEGLSPFLFLTFMNGGSRNLLNPELIHLLASKATARTLEHLLNLRPGDSLDGIRPLLAHWLDRQPSDYAGRHTRDSLTDLSGSILSAMLLGRVDIHFLPELRAFREGFNLKLNGSQTMLQVMDIPQCLKGIWSPARVITTPEDVIQRMECHWGYNNSGVGDHRLATVRSAFISFLRGTGYPKGEGEQLRVHGLYDPSKVAGDVGFRARLLWHALTGSPLLPLADNEKMTVRAGVMCALQCAIKVGTCARSLEFCWCATMQSWFVENGSVPDAGPRRDSFDDFFIVQLLCQVVATGGFSRA